jgi:hypothetical protein
MLPEYDVGVYDAGNMPKNVKRWHNTEEIGHDLVTQMKRGLGGRQ